MYMCMCEWVYGGGGRVVTVGGRRSASAHAMHPTEGVVLFKHAAGTTHATHSRSVIVWCRRCKVRPRDAGVARYTVRCRCCKVGACGAADDTCPPRSMISLSPVPSPSRPNDRLLDVELWRPWSAPYPYPPSAWAWPGVWCAWQRAGGVGGRGVGGGGGGCFGVALSSVSPAHHTACTCAAWGVRCRRARWNGPPHASRRLTHAVQPS